MARSWAVVHCDDIRPDDHDAVRALVLAGLADHWGQLLPGMNPDLDDLTGSYGHGRTLVVREGDLIVGTGTVVPVDPATAQIVRMSVDRSSRGTGIGGAIVDELLATARRWGAQRVVLETTSSWSNTIRFYERCGFSATHVVGDGPTGDTWFERRL
jgi:GNAT superfamily N-acetyltransferase